MNHLAHFKVSHPDPDLMLGAFLGDFVKGRLTGAFPEPVERGIRLHRAVDAFADRNEITRRSVARFSSPFRRYGPIMVDVIYDHFLARQWDTFEGEDLGLFCDHVFATLDVNEDLLPERAGRVAQRMCASRAMENYADETFIARSLTYIGTRLTRENPLNEGFVEFKRHEDELMDDFMVFFPELEAFCRDWQQTH